MTPVSEPWGEDCWALAPVQPSVPLPVVGAAQRPAH